MAIGAGIICFGCTGFGKNSTVMMQKHKIQLLENTKGTAGCQRPSGRNGLQGLRHLLSRPLGKGAEKTMKCVAVFFLVLLGTLLCNEAFAQRVTNANYQTVAHIKSDGTIQDASYKTIGHIKSDGTVQDANYKTVGHLKDDGTVQNANYAAIGHVKKDGTVQDNNYRTIGHIKQDGTIQDGNYRTIGHAPGIPMAWAAWYFFF